MFNTQKSDYRVNTEKYRNSKLHNFFFLNAGIGFDRYRPILRICDFGSVLKKWYRCIPNGNHWILDPFSVDPASEDLALSTVLENELMELSAGRSLKLQLSQIDLASLLVTGYKWISLSVKAGNQIYMAFHHHIVMWVRVIHCDYLKIKSKEQTETYFGCYSLRQSLTHFTKTWSYYLQEASPSQVKSPLFI